MNAMAMPYEFRLAGHLDDHWAASLGRLTNHHNTDGTTTLTAHVTDQAQLHGLLARLRDIGATLISLQASGTSAAPGYGNGEDQRSPSARRSHLAHPLQTERLTIRPATEQDADATWGYRRLESVSQWLTSAPADVDAYRAMFLTAARLANTVIVEIREGTTSGVIGDLLLKREDAWAQTEVADLARGTQAELGWVLDPAYTGHGYATEAVRELLRYCFEGLGVRRVVANCFLDNEASWRLMERVGMRRESHARRDGLHRSGRWLDSLAYALLAEEWIADRSRTR